MQTITAIHTSGIKLFRNFKKLNPNVIFISIKYEIIKLILYEIIAFLATVLISPNTIPSTIPIRVVDEDKTPVIKRFFVLPRLWNIAPELEFTTCAQTERLSIARQGIAAAQCSPNIIQIISYDAKYIYAPTNNPSNESILAIFI